jgi:integrase
MNSLGTDTDQVESSGFTSLLKDWLSKQKRKAIAAEITFKQTDPVFSDPPVEGDSTEWTPYLPSSLSQAFSRACKHHRLTGASFKSLRHTHASTLLKSNVHPKVVQERLGHSTITTTLDVYSHVMPGLQEAAARVFDQAFVPDSQQIKQSTEAEAL